MHDSHFIHHDHDGTLVFISVLIAAFASYTALDMVSAMNANRKEIRKIWVFGGALAMGIGIWSMHFIGMLAFKIPEVQIFYDVPILLLSICISVSASYFSLLTMSDLNPRLNTYLLGAVGMGLAISGMHYVGIVGMRMPYRIEWNYLIVTASILISIIASFIALHLAFKLRDDVSGKGYIYRGLAGIVMGGAISSMHYVGMAAMTFVPDPYSTFVIHDGILASEGLAAAVVVGSSVVLGLALIGSNIDRTLERKNLLNNLLLDTINNRDQFISIASHELKTPLTSLKLQLGILERTINTNDGVSDKVQQLIHQSQKSVTQINRVVEDMLDIARITTGKIDLEKEEILLCQFLSETIEKIRPNVENASNEITLDIRDSVSGVWDRFRIEQVITNIIMNALLYAKSTKIHVKLWKENNFVHISIEDNGVGIAAHEHEKIFKRYERGDSSRDYRGLGIGLFLVKEIISLHGGAVSLESDLGRGAKFTLSLPL